MKDLGKVRSNIMPSPIQITTAYVFVASNIQSYDETIDERHTQGYEYNLLQYDKDEYLIILAQKSQALSDELEAAKILLGVE